MVVRQQKLLERSIVNASGTAQLSDNWPVDITLNSTLNVEPLKGEKVKLKVGGALREQLEIGVNLSGPVDMDLRAQTRLAEAGLPLNVEVNSKQLYWPFTGEKQYQADDRSRELNLCDPGCRLNSKQWLCCAAVRQSRR